MRKVIKNLKDIPSCLSQASVLIKLEEIALGNRDLISDEIYKGEYKNEEGKTASYVREKLNDYYHHKCAYCELFCKAEIEHYRPKKGVTGEKSEHKGYYWLCYEWTNLLPSCRYCNTEGGKGNQFPILGIKRVNSPEFKNGKLDIEKCYPNKNPLQEEKPYLLHPEYDDPEQYLGFKLNSKLIGIDIIGIDLDKRGSETIRICNLNREYLRRARQQSVVEEIKDSILFIFKCYEEVPEEQIMKMLNVYFKSLEEKSYNDYKEHTLLRKFIIKNYSNFEAVLGHYFQPKTRILLFEIFKRYKA